MIRLPVMVFVFAFAFAAASADQSTTLGGVALGTSVMTVVQAFGSPGLVQTTDDGHEWRWYDAGGLDVDVLTDDALVVRQILVTRPEPVDGKPSKLVQPRESPVLELPAGEADTAMAAAGAVRQPEPENTISAWRVGENFIVLELSQRKVMKILGLDRASAARLGYAGSQSPAASYRAPRLVRQFAVDYPKRAIESRAQGVVVVRVDVSSTGGVKDARVVVSSGNADIDDAESLSMRKSTFRAARCNDQPCDGVFLDREEYTLGP